MQLPKVTAPRTGRIGLAIVAFLLAGIMLAGQADAQGARTERFFDDWTVACVEDAEGQVNCEMRQLHVTNQPRQNVFRWLIGRATEGRFAGQLVNVFQAPLGVSLPEGIEVDVDGLGSFAVAFEICGSVWCQGRVAMSDDLAAQMAAGASANIHYRDGRGNSVRTEATGRGFGDALQYLRSQGD
jgi:invasion protein IalB